MKRYSLSQEADRDIEGIARETVKRWGWPQAEKYLDELHQAFDTLVEFREPGRDVSYLRPGGTIAFRRMTAIHICRFENTLQTELLFSPR